MSMDKVIDEAMNKVNSRDARMISAIVSRAKAIAGILAAHADADINLPSEKEAAKLSYEYADAMLAERNK